MTTSEKLARNIRVFYTHQLLLGLSALWAPIIVIFQMQEIGLSLTEVMLGESIFAATIVLFEVPSGGFADRMGRKRTLLAGSALLTIGIIVFAVATTFAQIIASQVFFGLGIAFRSGADSALLFDSLKALNREADYQKILGRYQTISYLTAVPMNIAGGLIAAWFGFRWTIILTAIFIVLNLVNFFLLSEAPVQEEGRRPGKTALWYTWKALRYIRKHRIVRYTIAFAMIGGLGMKLSFHTLNPYWELWKVPVSYFGFAMAGYNLVAAFTSHFGYRVTRRLGDLRTLLTVLVLICVTFLAMAGVTAGIAAALIIPAIFQISRSLQPIAINDMINRVTYSHHRATVLSMKSFLQQLTQIALLPVFGVISDAFSLLAAFGVTAVFVAIFGLAALYRLYVLPADYQHGSFPKGVDPAAKDVQDMEPSER
jgi:MFS family permease